MPHRKFPSLWDALDAGRTLRPAYLIGAEQCIAFVRLLQESVIGPGIENLRGRSVLVGSADPFLSALALIELDGHARRLTLYPPDLALEHLPYVMRHAEVDSVVWDGRFFQGAPIGAAQQFVCKQALVPHVRAGKDRLPTEWILLTSGTTGRPKMVLHTLMTLSGAITSRGARGVRTPLAPREDGEVIWSTFYDIRRYGGLQIFLRAVLTGSSLLLAGPQEPLASFLRRAGEAGVTHISGTPSHWRQVLMSPEAGRMTPRYVRLSGEIADQSILSSLHAHYPAAEISHAFATTEAGVAFDVCDGLSGFPADTLTSTPGVELKVVDGTLRVRSGRIAERYLGENPPTLHDAEGFVDTGDVLELCDGRYHFHGRREGVINVGGNKVYPEEVESLLNRHPQVRLSLVKPKKNPITGALVVADILLKDTPTPEGAPARELEQKLKQFCRESLAPHKVPTSIRFVSALAVSETGKLVRGHG
jgi:acyl-coenzyme A synthetase/AMP-(fatty) acid ligase